MNGTEAIEDPESLKILEKDCIFLIGKKKENVVDVTADSLVALFTLECCRNPAVNVVLVERKDSSTTKSNAIESDKDVWFPVNVETLSFPLFCIDEDKCPDMIQSCLLPAVLTSSKPWCVAGLCSSLRYMLRKTVEVFPGHFCQKFLGFRGGCLQACAEVSVWTKFCEIESIGALTDFPIFTYLIKKNVTDKVQQQELCTKKLSELPELDHEFAEGLDMTLADIMLFGSFHILLSVLKKHVILNDVCPLVVRWYGLISSNEYVKSALPVLDKVLTMDSFCDTDLSTLEVIIPVVPSESLYKSDPERYKPRWRSYTHQHDIERILKVLDEAGIAPVYDSHPSDDLKISWSSYPLAFSPQGGELPAKRLERKCQQLENIVSAVKEVARDGDIIVDFVQVEVILSVSVQDYLILGHAADQTHDESNPKTKQGQKCMQLIDTDRLALAQSLGYSTNSF
nr:glutathione S-transferase C-terminal domain-containing protein-like [Penaeus vannamei]